MKYRSVVYGAAGCLLSIGAALRAQVHDHPAAGEFGNVHFATSCTPAVSPEFDRAVALLHSFEFGMAIQGFNRVLAADSSCVIAQWGIALSRWGNPMAPGDRAPALLEQGRRAATMAARPTTGRPTNRERGYIGAVNELYKDYERTTQQSRVLAYERAMAALVAAQPADTEAMIFHALALAQSALPTDKTYANQLRAGAVLETLWVKQPTHPGLAHYIIHAYDVPALASKAAAAAARYAEIAPSAPHALHMPSHTFTRVGKWEESINTNLKSISVARATRVYGEALHASDYAMYAYLQLGRDSAAHAILVGLPALAAEYNANATTGAAPPLAAVFAIAAIPARYALERRAWAEAAALQPRATAFPYAEAMTYFARALGASHTGNLALARASAESLAVISERLRGRGESYWAEQVAIQHVGAQAWVALAEHRNDEALARMRQAAAREDATEKSAVTPGPLAPARELLADMLLELGRPADALAEYRATLVKEPNRRRATLGATKAAAGR